MRNQRYFKLEPLSSPSLILEKPEAHSAIGEQSRPATALHSVRKHKPRHIQEFPHRLTSSIKAVQLFAHPTTPCTAASFLPLPSAGLLQSAGTGLPSPPCFQLLTGTDPGTPGFMNVSQRSYPRNKQCSAHQRYTRGLHQNNAQGTRTLSKEAITA